MEPTFTKRNNNQGKSDVDSAMSSDGNMSQGEESEAPEGEANLW